MWSLILSWLPAIVGFIFKRMAVNAEVKEKFLEFVASMEAHQLVSAKLNESDRQQMEELERMRQEATEEPQRVSVREVEKPPITEVDIKLKLRGQYKTKSGMPMGLVVHYTAGRFEKGQENAVRTMQSLADRGLGCLVMDKNGMIVKSKHQGFSDIAYHAGKSEWKGKSGVSQYCLGMEICNAGKLEKDGKSWFGLKIPEHLTRVVKKTDGYSRDGLFHKFTPAQEKSLIAFIQWQKSINPEFDLDWVVGHDEIAPDRKSDPGGSLSMSMPAFRDMLKKL